MLIERTSQPTFLILLEFNFLFPFFLFLFSNWRTSISFSIVNTIIEIWFLRSTVSKYLNISIGLKRVLKENLIERSFEIKAGRRKMLEKEMVERNGYESSGNSFILTIMITIEASTGNRKTRTLDSFDRVVLSASCYAKTLSARNSMPFFISQQQEEEERKFYRKILRIFHRFDRTKLTDEEESFILFPILIHYLVPQILTNRFLSG